MTPSRDTMALVKTDTNRWLRFFRRRRWAAILVMLAPVGSILFFFGGFVAGDVRKDPQPSFHDIRVIHAEDYRSLVDPRDRAVRTLAGKLGTPEAAYAFVRDRIAFDPAFPAAPPGEIIAAGAASCLGKATLLCSLYRALGAGAGEVRVLTGEVRVGGRMANHVWIDLEFQGRCLQQDPSSLLGTFGFSDFPGVEYSRAFVLDEEFCFNDRGLAMVSQMNRFRE